MLLVACFAAVTQAQPRLQEAEIYIGVHGGALASMAIWMPKIQGTEQLLNTVLLSGNGGFVFRYSKHKCCGLQVELNYMQRGWRENGDNDHLSVHYTRRLDYLELPFLAHIYFGSPHWRGIVNLGPQIGYCIHESSTGTKHPDDRTQYEPLDNKFDWGIAGGLGFYYRNQRAGVFQLEARFNYSLGDYFSNSKTAFFSQSHAMNLSLNLAYLWEIKPAKKKIKPTTL